MTSPSHLVVAISDTLRIFSAHENVEGAQTMVEHLRALDINAHILQVPTDVGIVKSSALTVIPLPVPEPLKSVTPMPKIRPAEADDGLTDFQREVYAESERAKSIQIDPIGSGIPAGMRFIGADDA